MDSTGKTGMQEVTVEVIDVDEDGTVTLSARRPLVNVAFTASLTDLDGGRRDQPHVAVGQVQQQERLLHRHRRRRDADLRADGRLR